MTPGSARSAAARGGRPNTSAEEGKRSAAVCRAAVAGVGSQCGTRSPSQKASLPAMVVDGAACPALSLALWMLPLGCESRRVVRSIETRL